VNLSLTRHNGVMNNNDIYENWDTPDTCYCQDNYEGECRVCMEEGDDD
jgi:hypothetical protein